MSYLSLIPNLTIAVPKDTEELKEMLIFSANYQHPLAIRYPRSGKVIFDKKTPIQVGKWEYLYRNDCTKDAKVTVIASGERCLILAMQILQGLQKEGKSFDVVNARFVKPLDLELLKNLKSEYVITIEDNVFLGGLGSMLDGEAIKMNASYTIKNFAYKDEFIHQGKVSDLQKEFGVDFDEIKAYIESILV